MIGLFFAFLFCLAFVTWSFDEWRVRWDLLGLASVVVGCVLAYALSRKTVQIDEQYLYASAFRHVVAIPLDQISEVTEEIGLNANNRTVTIRFRKDTSLGRSLAFTPTCMLARDPHPIVDELLAHVRQPSV